MRTPRVLLIIDVGFADAVALAVVQAAAASLPEGAFAVQLRDKLRPDRGAWAARLREVTRALRVGFVVNGDVALARAVLADGVHFGSAATDTDCASALGLWRSMASHTRADVDVARARGVDAVLVSPIFATPGKGLPRGLEALTEARAVADGLAVLALGGVDTDSARSCFEAGADGVAVIRSLLGATDPGSAARAMYDAAPPMV